MLKKIVVINILLWLVVTSYAASFDCQTANTNVEKLICNNISLSKFDSYLGILYSNSKMTNKLKQEQQNWLQSRNQCLTDVCLMNSYQQQILKLVKINNPEKFSNDLSQLQGNWLEEQSNQTSGKQLTISQFKNKGFKFHIAANSGANSGEIDGQADLIDNIAFYMDDSKDSVTPVPCTLMFEVGAKNISISSNDACESFGGISVSFDGNYVKNAKPILITLTKAGILPNAEQETKFKQLTGSDYQLFIDSIDVVQTAEHSKEPKATYTTSFVRGLANLQACIVMYDAQHLWAAVLDSEHNQIKYFTNDLQYKHTIPTAISQWIADQKGGITNWKVVMQ